MVFGETLISALGACPNSTAIAREFSEECAGKARMRFSLFNQGPNREEGVFKGIRGQKDPSPFPPGEGTRERISLKENAPHSRAKAARGQSRTWDMTGRRGGNESPLSGGEGRVRGLLLGGGKWRKEAKWVLEERGARSNP